MLRLGLNKGTQLTKASKDQCDTSRSSQDSGMALKILWMLIVVTVVWGLHWDEASATSWIRTHDHEVKIAQVNWLEQKFQVP